MATSLSYNGFDFGYLRTQSIRHVPQRDPSGSDQIYTRVILQVESFLYLDANAAQVFGSLTAAINSIKHLIGQDRQALMYQLNNEVLLAGDGTDEANGPKILRNDVIGVTSNGLRIAWSVEVAQNLCSTAGNSGTFIPGNGQLPYSSLRWSQTQSIDDAGYSTITTRGRLIGRRNVLGPASIDSLRSQIKPPLGNDFVRTGEYTMQADGLALDFVLTDKQVFLKPQPPAIKVSGVYSRSIRQGSIFDAEVSLRLQYRFPTDRLAAVNQALGIAYARLTQGNIAANTSGASALLAGSIREHLYEPLVEVLLKAVANPPAASNGITGAANADNHLLTWDGKPALGGTLDTSLGQADGFGFAPTSLPDGFIDLTENLATGEPTGNSTSPIGNLAGFGFLAQMLGDECTADNAMQAATALDNTVVAEFAASLTNDVAPTSTFSTPGNPFADPSISALDNLNLIDALPQYSADEVDSPFVGNDSPGVWTRYDVEYELVTDLGTRVMKATSAGVPVALCRIYNDVTYLQCKYEVERIGGPPEIPALQSYPLWALDGRPIRRKPCLNQSADGVSMVYRGSGEMRWVWLGVDVPAFDYPVPPWLSIDATMLPEPIELADANLENAS